MLLLGTRNIATQEVATDGVVSLGQVYRRYCRKCSGVKTFDFNGTSIALQQQGVYHITATITFSAPVAGIVTFQLTDNGVAIPGALATETITTATTEIRTTTLDYYVLVDSDCVLGQSATEVESVSIVNTGVDATITNVVVNVDKVV